MLNQNQAKMLEPLKEFICDGCGEVITDIKDGWVEWLDKFNEEKGKHVEYGFRIVHHTSVSPKKGYSQYGCSKYPNHIGCNDTYLASFLNNNNGMAHILSLLDVGPYRDKNFTGPRIEDIREYVEFMRRLLIPHYEEARMYWNDALADDFFRDDNEIGIYSVNNLKRLIAEYSNNRD